MIDWKENLLGVLLPAVPVPFNVEGKCDRSALESYAEWMSRQPVEGVAVWAHTGRGPHLDPELRKAVLECWRDAMGPERIMVAGVGPTQSANPDTLVSSALAVAEDAAGAADFLLVFPPTAYRDLENEDERIVNYHRALAGIGVPLLLFYLYPAAGGIQYSKAVLDTLLAMPEVAGMKMATLDSPLILQDVVTHVLINHPSKAVLTGEDRLYGYSLYRGCHGALVGLGALMVRLQRAMIDSWFLDETTRFLDLCRLTDHLAEAIFTEPMEGYIRRLLIGLAHLGIIPESAAYDPWGPPITPVEEEMVRATLDALEEWKDDGT